MKNNVLNEIELTTVTGGPTLGGHRPVGVIYPMEVTLPIGAKYPIL